MRAVDLIRKKRDSGEPSREELEFLISGYTNGDMQSAGRILCSWAIPERGVDRV